jgi:hypothetical protein
MHLRCLLLAALLGGIASGLGAFELVGPQRTAAVVVPPSEPECVRLAVGDLVGDARKITGKTLSVLPQLPEDGAASVLVISLNQPGSAALLEKIAPGFGDGLRGKWESYRVEEVGSRLIIVGSDERGTMFGLYTFIEQHLGVDPLYFWASRPPAPRATLSWDSVKFSSSEPSFKFRGWFITTRTCSPIGKAAAESETSTIRITAKWCRARSWATSPRPWCAAGSI